MNPSKGYGNFLVYSPDDILMFHTNRKRLAFYIKRNLIEQLSEKEYRLKFYPEGLGYSELNRNPLLLIQRENKCVCSGETDLTLLTRHHIIPSVFRRNFPEERKSNNFLFVVLVTRKIHDSYTIQEHKFYDEIARMYGVPSFETTTKMFQKEWKAFTIARTLVNFSESIPPTKAIELKHDFEELTGMKVESVEQLDEFLKGEKENYRESKFNFGKLVVNKIDDFDKFEMMWLNHFIQHATPKFLPEDLKNYISIYSEN